MGSSYIFLTHKNNLLSWKCNSFGEKGGGEKGRSRGRGMGEGHGEEVMGGDDKWNLVQYQSGRNRSLTVWFVSLDSYPSVSRDSTAFVF